MLDAHPYPSHWEADVVAADGGTVHIRPITPDDAERLERLHARLSERTIHYRFFSPRPRLSARDVERFTVVDHDDRVALVAMLGDDMIAVARYDRLPGTAEAEVAFVVEDRHQGRGLGTVLLEHLAAAARERGITEFSAETLPDNRRMLGVFLNAGWKVSSRLEEGVVRVVFSIDPTPEAVAAQEERERRSEARSMARLLSPRSVAVIGASRTPGTIGHELFRNLLDGGFAGPVYPVHRSAAHVGSVRAYASVVDIPDDVDLAVIVVPASSVLQVVEECAEKRVRGLVIVSAGFGELSEDGVAAEHQLVELARRHGMRVIGPGSMGIVNTAPSVCLHATVAGSSTTPGTVAFLSQSGALGVAILDWVHELGLGVSSFVSVGNKADVSGNDLLQFWESDERTDVVLLYLESFGNPRKFARLARRMSLTKPIVAVKGGRRRRGAVPTSTLTAAAGTTDVAVEALFRQTGVVRVDTLDQLFEVGSLLAHQPVPSGRRVVVVASQGGAGVLAADACEGAGLELATLSAGTRRALGAAVPGATDLGNPLHVSSWASPDDYGAVIRTVLDDDGVDAVLFVYTPPFARDGSAVAAAVASAAAGSGKPVAANLLRTTHAEGERPALPVFRSPDAAALALARAADYGDWRSRPEGVVPVLDGVDVASARALVDHVLAGEPQGTWLDAQDAARLLGCFGIPAADDPAAQAPTRTGLRPMLGVVQDPTFGPLVMLATGTGRAARRAFRITPLSDVDVDELVDLVDDGDGDSDGSGHGGGVDEEVGVARAVLTDLLLRVGCLVDEVPELAEADLHLVPCTGAGAGAAAGDGDGAPVAVVGRIRLSPWRPRPELALRRMR